jgi:hypothetical protein
MSPEPVGRLAQRGGMAEPRARSWSYYARALGETLSAAKTCQLRASMRRSWCTQQTKQQTNTVSLLPNGQVVGLALA